MLTSVAAFVLMAWAVEVCVGWPDWLYRKVAHPVVWMGALINWLETRFNKSNYSESRKRYNGILTVWIVVGLSAGIAWLIGALLPQTMIGVLIEAILASSLLASRSLYQHVKAVHSALNSGDGIEPARLAVSQIVGRSTAQMDEPAVARGTLESLAENTSDGVTAPLFWALMLGLPGLAAYKAINTLDSMIAHKNDRFLAFGHFAARLDDVVNLIPARLSALLFLIAGHSGLPQSVSQTLRKSVRADAASHRSPNAGWPESAMAHALGVRLSGPRSYDGGVQQEPWINGTAGDPLAADIKAGLALYVRAMMLLAVLLSILMIIIYYHIVQI